VPWIDYRELRRRLDMHDVLAWMKWQANTRRGEYLRGSCPFCSAVRCPRDRYFVVHVARQLFNCLRCKQGGDVLELWAKYRKTNLNAAATELYNLLPDHPKSSNQQSQKHQPPN
jgi:DNA primase